MRQTQEPQTVDMAEAEPVPNAAHPFDVEGVPRALWWDAAANCLRLIDQTLLPDRCEVIACRDADSVAEAIRTLRVRGAPAIGVAAAYGLALDARVMLAGATGDTGSLAPDETGCPPNADTLAPDAAGRPPDAPTERLRATAERVRATRPTAINLGWALDRVLRSAQGHLNGGGSVRGLPDALLAEAGAIATEDAAACRAMGALGAELIADGDTLLTHCNAGALATAGIGTALAPIFVAHASGKRLHVYVDETRPVLQGARLTAWELSRAGVPLTLISDNMAAHFMRHGGIRAVFVGADRIAANGDTANKIGTYGLAVLARAHGIPLYVVAPRSTVDLALLNGDAIPIEQRASAEVTHVRGVAIAPEGVPAANPAFDVTPAELVTAIVTEAGIARPPFAPALAKLCGAESAHRSS